jgi:hypothetical protein
MKSFYSPFRGRITTIASLVLWGVFLVGCKKDKQFNPEEVRLVGADVYSDNGVQHEIIDYNADGKIYQDIFSIQ